jgi:RNA polymerase sigma-70 factor (ECF subfamily)
MNDGNTKTFRYLALWNEGDRKGLDALIKRHLPSIRAEVRKRMGPVLRGKGETQDYVQDAMVEFLKYGPRFTLSNEAHFRALLRTIVENALRQKPHWFTARRRDIAREHPLPSGTVLSLEPMQSPRRTPSLSAAQHEQEAWVRLGLEFLNPEYRQVLVLRKWDNLSFAQIGERLGLSEVAARMKHNRAVSRLGSVIFALRAGKISQLIEENL